MPAALRLEPFRVEPVFDGYPVVIIGGGPSLSLKQIRHVALARLENRCRVIAVNDAYTVAWFADWLHACDQKFWNWHAQTATKFPGIRTCYAEGVPTAWARRIAGSGTEGFDPDSSRMRHGSSSGYQAMHIAIHAGASQIILLGMDMKRGADGASHWYGEPPDNIVPHYEQTMVPKFATLLPTLIERRIGVVNCSPGSALETFTKADLETVL